MRYELICDLHKLFIDFFIVPGVVVLTDHIGSVRPASERLLVHVVTIEEPGLVRVGVHVLVSVVALCCHDGLIKQLGTKLSVRCWTDLLQVSKISFRRKHERCDGV